MRAVFVFSIALLMWAIGASPSSAGALADCVVSMSALTRRVDSALAVEGARALDRIDLAESCGQPDAGWEILGYRLVSGRRDIDLLLRRTVPSAARLTIARLAEAIDLGNHELLYISLEPGGRDRSLHEFVVLPERVAGTRYLAIAAPLDVAVKLKATEWLSRYFDEHGFGRSGGLHARAFFVHQGALLSPSDDGSVVEIQMTARLVSADTLLGATPDDDFAVAVSRFCQWFNAEAARGSAPVAVDELVRAYRLNALGRLLVAEPSTWDAREFWIELGRSVTRVDAPQPVRETRLRVTKWPLEYAPVQAIVSGGVIFSSGDLSGFLAARVPGASFAFDGERHVRVMTAWREATSPGGASSVTPVTSVTTAPRNREQTGQRPAIATSIAPPSPTVVLPTVWKPPTVSASWSATRSGSMPVSTPIVKPWQPSQPNQPVPTWMPPALSPPRIPSPSPAPTPSPFPTLPSPIPPPVPKPPSVQPPAPLPRPTPIPPI